MGSAAGALPVGLLVKGNSRIILVPIVAIQKNLDYDATSMLPVTY
jgi:hypothetical protein